MAGARARPLGAEGDGAYSGLMDQPHVIVLFVVLQRQVTQGFISGALKG